MPVNPFQPPPNLNPLPYYDPTYIPAGGVYGGTKEGRTGELAMSDAGLQRGKDLTQQGVDDQRVMAGLGNDQMKTGAGYGAVGEGYGANARGDSDLSGAARAQSQQDLDKVRAFYEGGPGPSAAQAQLRQANDINNSATVSLARSGRGGVNPLASRDASFAQANAGQEMNRNSKILGAQEAADWRTQQGQAMGLEQAGLGAMRAGDLNTMAGNLQGGVNAGKLGHGYSELGVDTTHAGQVIGLGYDATAQGAAANASRLRGDILTSQSTAEVMRHNAILGQNTAQAELDAQKKAAIYGAAGTTTAGVMDTVFNHKKDDAP